MIEHGLVRSLLSPESVVVDEYSVWVAEDVHTVQVKDEQGEHSEYEYTLTQYTKDEYIHSLIERNGELETDMLNTQLALCDVYELIEGGDV